MQKRIWAVALCLLLCLPLWAGAEAWDKDGALVVYEQTLENGDLVVTFAESGEQDTIHVSEAEGIDPALVLEPGIILEWDWEVVTAEDTSMSSQTLGLRNAHFIGYVNVHGIEAEAETPRFYLIGLNFDWVDPFVEVPEDFDLDRLLPVKGIVFQPYAVEGKSPRETVSAREIAIYEAMGVTLVESTGDTVTVAPDDGSETTTLQLTPDSYVRYELIPGQTYDVIFDGQGNVVALVVANG